LMDSESNLKTKVSAIAILLVPVVVLSV